jgi:hypothetical protein
MKDIQTQYDVFSHSLFYTLTMKALTVLTKFFDSFPTAPQLVLERLGSTRSMSSKGNRYSLEPALERTFAYHGNRNGKSWSVAWARVEKTISLKHFLSVAAHVLACRITL